MSDVRAGAFSAFNLDSVALHALGRSDETAIHDLNTGKSLTYAELDEQVNRAMAWLIGRGVEIGQRVAMLSKNSIELAIIHLACERAGAIFVPLNWRLAAAELTFVISDAEPVILIIQPVMEEVGAALLASAPGLPGIRVGAELDAALAAADPSTPRRNVDVHSPVTLLYTSGTSGKPKGAIITSSNIFYSTVNYALTTEVSADSVALCETPLFHVLGLLAILRATLLSGGTVLLSDFDSARTLARLMDPALKVTHYCCVPQMAQMLRNEPAYVPGSLNHLRALVTGGAPHAPAEIIRWMDDGVTIVNGYGMTEAGSVLSAPLHNEKLRRATAGAAGVRLLSTQLQIVDDEGNVVPQGASGELWLRGPAITPGYWNRPDATAAAFTADGWFKTGDIAKQDAYGHYWLVDRKKDMYISGGENVYPAEVEATIIELPGIAEVAVIGVPDERWGEVGNAFVVAAPGKSVNAEDVIAHCKARLAAYKVPKKAVVIDVMPRNGAGKVQKQLLKA